MHLCRGVRQTNWLGWENNQTGAWATRATKEIALCSGHLVFSERQLRAPLPTIGVTMYVYAISCFATQMSFTHLHHRPKTGETVVSCFAILNVFYPYTLYPKSLFTQNRRNYILLFRFATQTSSTHPHHHPKSAQLSILVSQC